MLRTRLMLGLALLMIIVLSMGAYSIDKCSELGKRLESIGRDHDAAGHSLQELKQNCTVMTGALLSRLTGEDSSSLAHFTAAGDKFQAALDAEKSRKTLSTDESSLVDKLNAAFHDYRATAQTFLQSPASSEKTPQQLGKNTAKLIDLVEQLTLAHEQARTADGKEAGADINQTIALLILLMIIALVAFIMAWLGLNRGLIQPLRSLSESIRQVGEGNLEQKVPVPDKHELGTLAHSFNRMAEQLKLYRVSTTDELARLNTTIRATIASFPDPIFVLNSEGAVEFRNPEADQLAVQLLFSGVTRLPAKVDEKVKHVRATGQDYLPTLFNDAIKFHLDGQDRYFLPRIVLLRDENRETFGVAVILEDVTRMLLLDDVKSSLIATVSHELKTPLTSVRMALYLLYEKTVGTLNEKQMDLVTTARDDADRLLRTLNDLLDLAKLEQGPSQLTLSEVSPAEMVEGAVHAARDVAQTAGITLETEIAPRLPGVLIDRQRIEYVFSNLIQNALKYAPDGRTILVQATLGRNRAGKEGVRFSVHDHGPGITPEHQEHIFERFFRVPGSNKSGAGLGLFHCTGNCGGSPGRNRGDQRPGRGQRILFHPAPRI